MVKFQVDFGPTQDPIDEAAIAAMLARRPRRMMLSREWQAPLHEPREAEKDWSLVLPFCETLRNSFKSMCSTTTNIGLRASKGDRCFTFFPGAQKGDESLTEVESWLATVGKYVAIRDCLALSFALDYDREGGAPSKPQTAIGALRSRAKPYDAAPTADTRRAADELVKHLRAFLKEMTCYNGAEAVCAMPPSRPDKAFDLPSYLVAGIASKTKLADITAAVRTVTARPALKDAEVSRKLALLKDTIEIDAAAMKGKVVLLVDDLYQSGVSMNYVGMLLLGAGAKKVFGLAVEKTCRNDANV